MSDLSADLALPYNDNAAFLDDLRRFVESLLAQAHGDMADPAIASRYDASYTWRTIAARMAATVTSEIFIPLAHVALAFQLDAREVQLLTLALMVETDRSINEAFASLTRSLQETDDDDTNGRSTADTAEHTSLRTATYLLGDMRACLFSDSALCARQLIDLVDVNVATLDGGYRLAHALTAYLLGLAAPQPRIGDHLAIDVTAEEGLDELIVDQNVKRQWRRFVDICAESSARSGSIVLHIETDDVTLAGALAAAAFADLGYGIAQLDARFLRWAHQSADQRLATLLQQLRMACRDAALCTQVLMLTQSEALIGNEEREQIDLFDSTLQLLLKTSTYVVILNGPARRVVDIVASARQQGVRLFQVRVPPPTAELRRQAWQKHATYHDLPLDDTLSTAIAGAYAFTEARIASVVDAVAGRQALNGDGNFEPLLWDACRAAAEDQPIGVAKRVDAPYRLSDLVAPERTMGLLQETLGQMRCRSHVIDAWGFGAKYPGITNLCVLFYGPPGTGKTMASSILANELSLPLYRVDLSAVLSKYIGETERNIEQLFARAELLNVVLLFDEAEGLFSKRTETKDSHDRFANLQVGFLLQRIESYPGLVILSTNLMSNLDKAFLRRFRFIIEFPFPTSDERLRLWRQIFPAQVRLDADVDLGLLAQKASLAGGHIRNAAISAAFLAARDGTNVKMMHLVKSVGREYEKLGKLFSESEF
ncbi:ATP-binding protein [Trinickia acidisoli]|uniref:ATP-binding protein n=1 Tax=Trinickia acidisoli TaxID=2767482 RepID=UPI001A8EDF36|nr:ATP-binding protein [Trinickia acidisoli]